MTYKKYSYVFILTYARSGSTLVQSILNSIPGYQIRGENNNALFHIYKCVDGVRSARNIHGFHQTEPDTPWYGADKLTPRLFKQRMLNNFVEGVLKPEPDVSTIGFKEIRHTPFFMTDSEFEAYALFILDAFPDSKIICNSRNAESVANSAWLKEQNTEDVIREVDTCDRRFAALAGVSGSVYHVRYDEYVKDRGVIRGLFEFLGEEYDACEVDKIFAKPLTHARLDEA